MQRPSASLRLPLTQPPSSSSGTAWPAGTSSSQSGAPRSADRHGRRAHAGLPALHSPGPPHSRPAAPRARSGRFLVWAVGRRLERAFPCAGSERMLGAGVPQCWVTGECAERTIPAAGSRGDAQGDREGDAGPGPPAARARRRETPARPSATVP